MNQFERPSSTKPVGNPPEESYPSAVESLSGKWRSEQAQGTTENSASFLKRNSTVLGVGIGIAIVIFLAIVGGFLLLVWTVNR